MKTWCIDGPVARLQLPALTSLVDSARPAIGLTELVVGGAAWDDAHLLGVSNVALSAAARVEWHVRGDDLIAAYEIGPPDAARIDLCWRATAPTTTVPWLACIDLLISVRTDRLDWRHDVCIESHMPGAAANRFAGSSDLQGCAAFVVDSWNYAEFVHPADLRRDELTELGGGRAGCHFRRQLFRVETLEKGVILRARARGLFLPPTVPPATVADCYAAFLATEPRLDS